MRLPLVLGTGALMTGVLLMGGLVATTLAPMPVVNVDAMELDGASMLSTPLPEVSPHPELVVRVSRALKPGDWRVVMDGRTVPVSTTATGSVLRVALPGPRPLGSRHTVQLAAGAMHIRAAFKIVPPLTAAVNMHLYHLQADAQASVAATIRFSRTVADKTQAQEHLTVSGNPTFTWRDAQTVEVVSTGFRLSDHAVVMIDPGIEARDGTRSRKFQSAGLAIPSTLTQVEPGRMVQMYYVNTDDGRTSLFAHLNQIDVLSPAWYDANADGSITGYARRDVIDAAHALSFMTYDEHNGVTPPGPVSGTPWMRRALEFSMQGVPPEKGTIGLPTYYHDWTGVGRLTSSSYADALILAQTYGATPTFDGSEEEMHFGYSAYGVHHELWIQSTDTLRRKLPLMYEYGLKGISVWRLGFEDPSFWTLIPPRR